MTAVSVVSSNQVFALSAKKTLIACSSKVSPNMVVRTVSFDGKRIRTQRGTLSRFGKAYSSSLLCPLRK